MMGARFCGKRIQAFHADHVDFHGSNQNYPYVGFDMLHCHGTRRSIGGQDLH